MLCGITRTVHTKKSACEKRTNKDPRKYIETRHIAGGPEPGRRDHLCVPSAGGRRYSFPFRFKTGSARLIGHRLRFGFQPRRANPGVRGAPVRGGAGGGWTL